MKRGFWCATLVGVFLTLLSAVAAAIPVSVTIDRIQLIDPDRGASDVNDSFYVTEVTYNFVNIYSDLGMFPGVTVCGGSPTPPPQNVACWNHIGPTPGDWTFTSDVPASLGVVDVRIEVRENAAIAGIDMGPGNPAPADFGLHLRINLVDGTWTLAGDPTEVSPTVAQSDLIGPGDLAAFDSRITGRVFFRVDLCGSAGLGCSNGSGIVCEGSTCSSNHPNPACSGGAVSCGGGVYSCDATVLDVPEDLANGMDEDCDNAIDECNASQLGQTVGCFAAPAACPDVLRPGLRTCTVANQTPGECVLIDAGNPAICDGGACTVTDPDCAGSQGTLSCTNDGCRCFPDLDTCLPDCPSEIPVNNVTELRAAIQQAALTNCKDVIVLAPGTYDVFDQQLSIQDSLEIRGQGTSFGCAGLDYEAFTSSTLSPDLGSLRCDGDDGENPRATVLTTTEPVDAQNFRRVMSIGSDGTAPEVTLRHLAISEGYSTQTVGGDEGVGILSRAGRLELFNVIVERNIAAAPGAGILHQPAGIPGVLDPTLLVVNSIVRENRSTTSVIPGNIGAQGTGGGMQVVGGTSFILRSAIVDNAAVRGAGIAASDRLSIFNSTISGNVAGAHGGGIWFASGNPLSGPPSLLELHHVTVTNNAANWLVGGILGGGQGVSAGAGIAMRYGGTVQLHGSIVAGNIECSGDQFVRCTNDSDCAPGTTCSDARCGGPQPYPPPLDRIRVCPLLNTDCAALEEQGQNVGTFESWGGNVASEWCGVNSSFLLPSGETAEDAVIDLYASRACSERSPLQDALDLFCYRGFVSGGSVGGQNDDPTLPAGDVPPAPGLEPFLREDFTPVMLVGPLAYNGGPTPTHAVMVGGLAAGTSETLDDPGDIADGFPSAVPACPLTDQRGFAAAAGMRPAVCDSGSYQAAATSPLSADELALELSVLFPDGDGDGIADNVDAEPEVASARFDDSPLDGWTSGTIVNSGAQDLRIFDAQPNPRSGVVVIGLSSGGAAPATVRACEGAVEVQIEPGEIEWIDCPSQPGACVLATEQLNVHDRADIDVPGVLGGDVALGTALLASSVFARGDLVLQGTTIEGDAVASGSVSGATTADVSGVVSEGAYLQARTVQGRSVSVGTESVVVAHDQFLELPPGTYGSLLVNDRGTLALSPGSYTFADASFGNDTRLELYGLVRIATQSSLSVGDRFAMSTPAGGDAAPDLVEWYTNASIVTIGNDVTWAGTLLAPHATVTLRDRTSFEGCLATRSLSVGFDTFVVSRARLSLVPSAAADAECAGDGDCPGGTCQGGACVPGGACSEATAVDLGVPGQQTSVPNNGCVRIRDGYPSWWGTRQMKLETTSSGAYPVPFTWTNGCGGPGGSGVFDADWASRPLPGISSACATVVDLQGSGTGNVTLRYFAQ
jgi:hypothetical protein